MLVLHSALQRESSQLTFLFSFSIVQVLKIEATCENNGNSYSTVNDNRETS